MVEMLNFREVSELEIGIYNAKNHYLRRHVLLTSYGLRYRFEMKKAYRRMNFFFQEFFSVSGGISR